ncbi:DUF2157 domain-containing protein [Salinifilum ghardaiensis]
MAPRITEQQRAAVHRLVERGVLRRGQVEAVLAALEDPEPPPGSGEGSQEGGGGDGALRWGRSRRSVLFEVLAYVGGTLVLGAAVSVLALTWGELSRAGQVSVLGAVTAVLLVAALALAGGPRALLRLTGARQRVVSLLLAFAGVALAGAVGVAPSGHTGNLDWSITGFLAVLLGYLVVPAAPGALLTCLFSALLTGTLVDEYGGGSGALGTALLLLGLAWAVLALVGALPQRALPLSAGLVIALFGAQWLQGVAQPWGYGATLVLAALCFAGFFARRDQVLLAGGVVGLTIAVPEAVWDLTEGALGGPVVVLIAGVVLLVSAVLGVRWERSRAQPSRPRGAG